MRIRAAQPDEVEQLRAIELAAGAAFASVGRPDIAAHDPPPADVLAAYARNGRAWVAVDDADDPIGYMVIDRVDDAAHIEQVSVHPTHQGRGIGRALIDEVERWARTNDLPALTLTTFADVPWNAPLYAHLGFVVLAEDEVGPELGALCVSEADHGLDPADRVCMRRAVG